MKPLSPVKEFKRQAAVWHNDVQNLVQQWKSFSPPDQAATVQVLLLKAAAFYEESVFDVDDAQSRLSNSNHRWQLLPWSGKLFKLG